MNGKITLLGTGTCQLQAERMASSVLIELDGLRIVYDMGRGVAQRLAEMGFKSDDIQHVVLSHFHPDHLSDLIPFLHAASWSKIDPRSRDLHIYGPLGVEVQIMRLLSLFGPNELTREHFAVRIHEIQADAFDIEGHAFDFVHLPPTNNHGLRFTAAGKTYALTGDSAFHEQAIEFLRDVDVAVIDSGHLTDEQIVDLAADSQAKMIICSHLYRALHAERLFAAAKDKGYTGQLIIGADRMSLDLE